MSGDQRLSLFGGDNSGELVVAAERRVEIDEANAERREQRHHSRGDYPVPA